MFAVPSTVRFVPFMVPVCVFKSYSLAASSLILVALPLMMFFSLLEPLVKYVLSLPWEEHHIPAEKVVFHITTNATLLTRKMVEFFIRYHFTLAISFDGPPEENDKYRVFKNG